MDLAGRSNGVRHILETRGIVKRFSAITALSNINFALKEGEIHAIMGENGAGKSTFCNVLTGVFPPDEGEVYFSGKKVRFTHPRQALQAGIRMVYQERNLIPFLTGAQSICLGLEERRFGFFTDERKILQIATDIKRRVASDVPLDIEVRWLSPAHQQMIEILRAIVHSPKLLILDEPTASLGKQEVENLFGVLCQLKEKGVSIILISHKLSEIYSVADTISIFRNGALVATEKASELSRTSAITYMLGREIESQFPHVEDCKGKKVLLELRDFSDFSGKLTNINLHVTEGEVVGLYGLVGSGRTELAQTIFGINKRRAGKLFFEQTEIEKIKNPRQMIKKGVLLVPEDRKQNGLFLKGFRLKENLTIGILRDELSSIFGLISIRKEISCIDKMASSDAIRLKFSSHNQDVEELSGGNQQKTMIARWIFKKNMKFLIMDEPTQGIDVGVKYDIYVLIRSLAKENIGVLLISSELTELIGICDRLYVLRDGKIKAEVKRSEFDKQGVMEMVV